MSLKDILADKWGSRMDLCFEDVYLRAWEAAQHETDTAAVYGVLKELADLAEARLADVEVDADEAEAELQSMLED